jgi:hypothetical protein
MVMTPLVYPGMVFGYAGRPTETIGNKGFYVLEYLWKQGTNNLPPSGKIFFTLDDLSRQYPGQGTGHGLGGADVKHPNVTLESKPESVDEQNQWPSWQVGIQR